MVIQHLNTLQNSSAMLNGSETVDTVVLFLILEEKLKKRKEKKRRAFSFSLLIMMLAVNLSYMAFIMLRNIPSIPNLLRVFIMEKW